MTLRELRLMVRGRTRRDWDHTSAMLAMMANINRSPEKRPSPYEPADFHPLMERPTQGIPLTKENFGMLKDLFVRGK